MKNRKSEDQVNAEIAALEALKPKVRKRTAFGDDNHAAIDAQLDVLRKRMNSDDVYDTYGDEDADEFDQYVLDSALAAHDWMTGLVDSDEEAPVAGWSGLAQ